MPKLSKTRGKDPIPAAKPQPGDSAATVSAPRAQIALAGVRVQDFRGLRDLCTTLDSLTVLIGENNAGKTSFLQALGIIFGPSRASHDDFHVAADGTRSERFVIDVRLTPATANEFDDGMRARFKGAIQFPDLSCSSEYVVIRATGEVDPAGGGVSLERRFVKGWADSRAAASALELLPDHVGVQHLELVAFFLLDARRDLVEELRVRNSHWGRLLSELEIAAEAKAEIEKQLDKLSLEIIEASPILAEVKAELRTVRDALTGSVSDVAISPLPGRVEELARGVDVLLKPPSGTPLPMRLHGQGARSLAAVMVFKSFIQRRVGASQTFRPLVVAAFEEPEAHLHPQAHRAMFHLIAALDAQRIVSTHSPYVVKIIEDIHSIRLLRRASAGAINCKSVPRTMDKTPTFTAEEVAQVRKFVLRNNGEALFARLVVVSEGDTEDQALPVFAKHHWQKDHAALGVSFARTDGAGAGKHVVRVLSHLDIPWVLFADGDSAGKKAIAAIEKLLQRKLEDHELVQLPKDACLEQYLIDEGYREPIEKAIADCHGDTALADYRDVNHGQKLNKTATRDYKSNGWEQRLVLDYCRSCKGTFGEGLATGILKHSETATLAPLPKLIAKLFERVDKALKDGAS
jgi:putative ATP-dependent endonuclease of OLD family